MKQTERPQSILDLLRKFRGLEPLKQLFWSEFNYRRINQGLSRRGWNDTAANPLAEDPLLFAGGGKNNDFHIIYARLASDRLLRGHERPVVSRLLDDHPYALFLFSNADQDRWHFINVKYDKEMIKRRLFRRMTIGPEERLCTASERLALLDQTDLLDMSPLEIQKRHDEAFEIEAVQKDFFQSFAEVYHDVAQDIGKIHGLKKECGKLAQWLLNRMLFLYFIQKKGWLDQKPDYLYSRFRECLKRDPEGNSYYAEILYPLFMCLSKGDIKIDSVGAVPFLNGGLFEEPLTQTHEARLQIKNTTFKLVFENLLEKFDFTLTEGTPLDVDVAIDPEMLGKIFESLILQLEKDPDKDLQKLTGSYYTPRTIVHFMCQKALKEYLVTQLVKGFKAKSDVVGETLDQFISLPPADQLDDEHINALTGLFTDAEAKTLRQAILDCRVCDPAVGSGAFPVGMLHEMVDAVARLDLRLHGKTILARRNYYYDLKKQIIECSLYGIDIQERAVRLCELRLWLSLIVDYHVDPQKSFDREIREVPTLPNLSYRIIRGDSLKERLFGHVVQLDPMDKDTKTQQPVKAIEVKDGFDVVIGNPPWGIPFSEKDKTFFRANFVVAKGIIDSFALFIERGTCLLNQNGVFSMILPDIVLLKAYPAARKFLLDNYRLTWVMFWGMVFGDVNLDSCTLVGIRETDAMIRQHNLIRASTEKQDVRRIPQSYFEKNTGYKFNLYWNPDIENLKQKTEAGAQRFGELFHSHEGIHSGNIRRKLFVDRKINSTCRPLIFGRSEIRQYGLIWAGTYVHYRADIIDKPKGEYAHLAKEEYFTQPKILIRRTGDHVMAAVDRNNFFCSNNLFVCVPRVAIDLDFVAAVLNSNLMTWYFRTIQPRVKRLFAELKIVHINEFPINHSKPHDIRELSELGKKASKLALSKGSEEALGSVTSAINRLVYQLYGLDEKETKLIEHSLRGRSSGADQTV